MVENNSKVEMVNGEIFTTVDRGTVTLSGSKFRVEEVTSDNNFHEVWLVGARGARYFLRPYLEREGDTGLRQIISWNSGYPLHKAGNEIRAIVVGDVIEEYKAPVKRYLR